MAHVGPYWDMAERRLGAWRLRQRINKFRNWGGRVDAKGVSAAAAAPAVGGFDRLAHGVGAIGWAPSVGSVGAPNYR